MRTDRDNDCSSDFSASFLFFVPAWRSKTNRKWSTYMKISERSFSDFKKRFVLDGYVGFQDKARECGIYKLEFFDWCEA